MDTHPQEGRFYTLSVNKVTDERDYTKVVWEVLGVNDTHAIIKGITRGKMLVFGYQQVDAPEPQPHVVLISEFDWTPATGSMLSAMVEAGANIDRKKWLGLEVE